MSDWKRFHSGGAKGKAAQAAKIAAFCFGKQCGHLHKGNPLSKEEIMEAGLAIQKWQGCSQGRTLK